MSRYDRDYEGYRGQRSSRRAVPGRFIALLAFVTIVIVSCLLLFLVLRDTFDPIRRSAAQSRYYRDQQIATETAWLDPIIASGWKLLPLVLVAGAGYVGLRIAYNRFAHMGMVEWDKKIAYKAAEVRHFPEGLKTLTVHGATGTSGDDDDVYEDDRDLALPEQPQEVVISPTYTGLKQAGYIRNSDYSLFIGLGDNRPGDVVEWKWSRDSSGDESVILAIAGSPGSGKTNTAANLITAAADKGIGLLMADPQANSGDHQALWSIVRPIERALLRPVATTEDETLALAKIAYSIGMARERGETDDRTPILLAIEEAHSFFLGNPNADVMAQILIQIAQRFRKFNVRVMLIGTSWSANIISGDLGATLRNLIRLKVLHGMGPNESGYLTYGLGKSEIKQIENLQKGWAVTYGPGVLKRTSVPLLQPDMAREVGMTLRPLPDIYIPEPVEVAPPPNGGGKIIRLSDDDRDTLIRGYIVGGTHNRDQIRERLQRVGLSFDNATYTRIRAEVLGERSA